MKELAERTKPEDLVISVYKVRSFFGFIAPVNIFLIIPDLQKDFIHSRIRCQVSFQRDVFCRCFIPRFGRRSPHDVFLHSAP